MNHLPEGTTVYLVEVDLKSMHVETTDKDTETTSTKPIKFSKEAMKKVKPAIDKRRRLRNERKREEQSYEQKYLDSQMEELYLFDDSQFPTVYNNQPEFYDNTESFPTISNESPPPPNNNNHSSSQPSSSSSLASQMKMGMPSSSKTTTPTFGFAAKMRNPMSLLPENQAETYNTRWGSAWSV
jgi:hypothetical protein